MKNFVFFVASFAILALSAFTTYQATSWKIADGYSIKFTSENPTGIFRDLKGDIIFDESDLGASRFNVTVDAATINTGNGMQNRHAKSAKWFDVENHPAITFQSTEIRKKDTGFEVVGKLTLVGQSREITFPFTFENNTFVASFEVDRTEFNLGSVKGPAGKASKVLQIDLSVPVTN